ncbi:GNAT family N-acetyltransferase [Actinophytocola algeriensis]|uniref:Ribosomal protein S18 acetylase RimI-like enzyme n=1 Tax=Actinophytocola algeriensis TaxID=1768010 RepID=A0A7W7QCC6_9PSEU|nr:GNAT family N-acetyltransferase [Actinophytocola algeriensis]MBB4911042.1 ribosomal protein S18 acetylase RimI-like enzyme [Actinophytocola algeriensis]MBE1474035.1 ribosomal protein S18 acetylase RimI-like enzyme [Actinophytocola algeriensis]
MTSPRFRAAARGDAEKVGLLHAESWRRHYRGAYADAYLDGDVVQERVAEWSARLADQTGTATVLAEDPAGLAAFVHVMFDKDDRWGSLVDNLHVSHDRQRGGIGAALMARAAAAVASHAVRKAMYLWVLEQNTAAQGFYRAIGGTGLDLTPVPPPGGVPQRLDGVPLMRRFVWPDLPDVVVR